MILYRPILQAIALKMVGTFEDAEDIVQDTYEKWLKVDTSGITNAKAYLIRSVQNNAIKFLESFRNRVKHHDVMDCTDTRVLEDKEQSHSIFHFDLEAQVSQAWEVLHRKLEPVEKSIFVMREVFNVDYEELQEYYDKKSENLRQIVSRAKIKLQQGKDRFHLPVAKDYIPESFHKVCNGEHISAIFHELTQDIKEKLK
jgi:RNA polymerase sigma factor (sigma-70 family)